MSQQSQPQQHSQERYQDDNGDAEGGAGGSSQPKHWLDTIVPFVQDTRGVFTEQDDLEGIYSVEGAVQRTDDAKVRELDVVRDRLRGGLRVLSACCLLCRPLSSSSLSCGWLAREADAARRTPALLSGRTRAADKHATALSRQAESYKHSAQRPSTAPSERQHEARLVELDTKRYGLVKTIADLDGAISSAEMQLARAREDTARAAQEDPTLGAEDGMGTV